MGLQRKKVTVRTKKGKVYQRSMLVKGTAQQSANRAGKLHSLNPWEQRHIEHVGTNSVLGERARAYGSSGPGSDHSALAHIVGAIKHNHTAEWERHLTEKEVLGRDHAWNRRHAGNSAAATADEAHWFGNPSQQLNRAFTRSTLGTEFHDPRSHIRRRLDMAEAFGVSVQHVRRLPSGRLPEGWGHGSGNDQ